MGSTGFFLTLERIAEHGWVVLSSGAIRIATWVTDLNGVSDPVVFAVLSEEES